MTDLPTTLPNFPCKPYSHLLPSLDRHGIRVADLLSLDALEIAKRASVPLLDLRRLANHVVQALQEDMGVDTAAAGPSPQGPNPELASSSSKKHDSALRERRAGIDVLRRWNTISLLDENLDKAVGGGIPTRHVSEITGER
jgi:DNA repair protein RAD57